MKKLHYLLFFLIVSFTQNSFAQLTIPYIFENSSRYDSDEIYVALVGKTSELGDVWMNMTDSQLRVMSANDNTIPGPDFSFPREWLYPEIFTKLSDLTNNSIQIPQGLFACRIFISFESPMYLHFHETGGYAGANLNNPGDPNDGIRWEIVELTWGDAGLWTNTSRVDAYQYPMGLEVTGFSGGVTSPTYTESYNRAIGGEGVPQYKRIGEVLPHNEILDAWDRSVSEPYKVAKIIKEHSIDGEPIIEQPSKVEEFPRDILDDYIDDIWNTYRNSDLNINIGDRGTWVGRVNTNGEFKFTDPADGSIATIYSKPTSINAIEGSGSLAFTPHDASVNIEAFNEDLMIQAQIAASISRHAIYTSITDNTVQFSHDATRFFQIAPFNEYVEFFHNEDISFESQTYAFAYDDVGDHSSTIQTTFPTEVTVTIGGFSGQEFTENEETEEPETETGTENLALNGTATQSSTGFGGNASRAIDGNTSGIWNQRSITHTNNEANAWWQVDLGTTQNVGVINIFNRTNCCSNRLDNFTVSVINNNGTTTFSQSYTTAPNPSISLNANGASGQIIRVELDDTNYLSLAEVEVYEFDGTTDTGSTLFIEAEGFIAMSGVQLENTNDTNGGQNVGFIDNGDWMEYSINVPSAGTYTINTRVASVPGNAAVQFIVDGSVLGTTNIDTTDGWQSWTTVSNTIDLSAGAQTLRLLSVGDGFNINWFEITDQNTTAAKSINSEISEIIIYPVPVIDELNVMIPNYEDYSNIEVVNLIGQVISDSNITGETTTINVSSLSNSLYLVRCYKNGQISDVIKFIK